MSTEPVILGIRWSSLARRGIDVRGESSSDAEFLLRLYRSVRGPERQWAPWNDLEWNSFVESQFRAREASYSHRFPELQRLVLQRVGNPLGSLWLHPTGKEIRIVDIAFLPEFRNQGLGTAALQDVQTHAAAPPQRSVILHVYSDNPALRLYRRMGFATVHGSDVGEEMRWQPAP